MKKPVECQIPASSGLDRATIAAAYFKDACRAPLQRPQASVVDIFTAVFAHHPLWMKRVLIMRHRLASLCGLDAPSAAQVMNPRFGSRSYAVGETIGTWPIFALTDSELVAGRDNKHLDFRLSVLKETIGGMPTVVISTLCTVHNTFGKLYLFVIVPFHKWGVRRLLASAIAAGRL
jgi:hypothetical protein